MADAERSFEDRIFDAVVARFFDPTWTSMGVWNPATNQSEMQMVQQPSAAARVAADIFAAQQQRITDAVKERLDMEVLADAVWLRVKDHIVAVMTSDREWYSRNREEKEALQKMVRERVADELARRQLVAIDAAAAAEEIDGGR